MVFLNSLSEKYVGKQIEINCVDVEIHRFEDNQPPIFKGPGLSGAISLANYHTKSTIRFKLMKRFSFI